MSPWFCTAILLQFPASVQNILYRDILHTVGCELAGGSRQATFLQESKFCAYVFWKKVKSSEGFIGECLSCGGILPESRVHWSRTHSSSSPAPETVPGVQSQLRRQIQGSSPNYGDSSRGLVLATETAPGVWSQLRRQFQGSSPSSGDSSRQCCGSGPFFVRIRIRGSGFLNTDPDPDDPKKAGSDRIRILLRFVLDVSKINIFFYGIFLPNLIIL